MKILVVDDEPSSLKLAHVVLSSSAHDVCPAEGAQAALEMIHEDKPTLILLDLVLPDMDGLDLIRQIKNDPETWDIHIIALLPTRIGLRKQQFWKLARRHIW